MGKLTCDISLSVRDRQARGSTERQGISYRRSLAVKRYGGSGRLQIAKDVAIESRSGHGLDAIVLE